VKKFDYSLDYINLNLRDRPGLYRIGRGEQGVLSVEPYKSEILPHWRFKDPETATTSAEKIYGMFVEYLNKRDFVGADMARKFLQMGHTRARRYANYKGGKKYIGPVPPDKNGESGPHGREIAERGPEDPVKAESARIFKTYLNRAKNNPDYISLRSGFIEKYGR